jgi:ATP-dependent Zn protease
LTASIPNFRNRQEWNWKKPGIFLRSLFTALFWIGIMALFYFVLFRKMGGGAGGPGGQIFSIGKSRAKLFDEKDKIQVTFKMLLDWKVLKKKFRKL